MIKYILKINIQIKKGITSERPPEDNQNAKVSQEL